ncbi:SigE family RNA polymerase sigma factor [Streptomyces sp. NBC_01198]|uniref:SigE family RNA polymerase sigma factor n=1 Tax=Streptomyces sp. NBC_01198 TaxID=2903769 RepID=UPI002E0DF894|nr:SigE family RNA polymerase sigma factor [Streptomyces sp. NBC_01198]
MTYERHSDHTETADSAAFAAFAAQAWPRLVRTAHLLTGDFQEAEDLVQHTLAKVYGRWRSIPRDEVDTYVRSALVNNNRSRVRKRRVTELLMPFLAGQSEPSGQSERPPSGHSDALDERAAVLEVLKVLSARQRTVLVLRFYEDMSEQEIAWTLNCSVGTVKTHTRRGLAAMRAHPSLSRNPTSEPAR